MDPGDKQDDEDKEVEEAEEAAVFAPDEPTDGRSLGEWITRYGEPRARFGILGEAIYLSVLFTVVCAALVVAYLDMPEEWSSIGDTKWASMFPYVVAFLGGALGGTLFDMKWLYHSVARGIWNEDRRLWRIFTPILSAGAALTIVVMIASGIVPLFGRQMITSGAGALGIAVLVGYFSDRTFSMLERMADEQIGHSN